MHTAAAALLLVLAQTASHLPPFIPPLAITSVAPSVGNPHGGEIVRITGTGFSLPMRVLFELPGEPLAREAFLVRATATELEVITPNVTFASPTQQITVDIHVLNQAGTASEQRVTAPDAFTYRNVALTPLIHTISPSTGPMSGGTRIALIGEGFQVPVLVLFSSANGSAELRVIDVRFDMIVAEVPPAADLNARPNESVDAVVLNINSGTRHVLQGGFRYLAAMAVHAVTPRAGPATGGTDLTIDGIGFTIPMAVTVAGIPARVLRVSNTSMLVRTEPAPVVCNDVSGPVEVISIANGDLAQGPHFTYIGTFPVVTNISPTVATAGSPIEVTLSRPPTDPVRVTLDGDDVDAELSGAKLSFFVPHDIRFERRACTYEGISGFAPVHTPIDLAVTFANRCSDLVRSAITLVPPDPVVCTLPPAATVMLPASGPCLRFGRADAPRTATLAIANRATIGTSPLVITGFSVSGPEAAEFEVRPASRSLTARAGGRIEFTVHYKANKPGQSAATVMFRTNDPNHSTIEVCLRASGL